MPANALFGRALLAAKGGHMAAMQWLVQGAPEGQRIRADLDNGVALLEAAAGGHLGAIVAAARQTGSVCALTCTQSS